MRAPEWNSCEYTEIKTLPELSWRRSCGDYPVFEILNPKAPIIPRLQPGTNISPNYGELRPRFARRGKINFIYWMGACKMSAECGIIKLEKIKIRVL
jgi:hypothetical protein